MKRKEFRPSWGRKNTFLKRMTSKIVRKSAKDRIMNGKELISPFISA